MNEQRKRDLISKWGGAKTIVNFDDMSPQDREDFHLALSMEPFTSEDAERVGKVKEKTKKLKESKRHSTKKKVKKDG